MSNKIQVNCNLSNKFNVWYIKYLEKVIKEQYFTLEKIDQKIRENDEKFDSYKIDLSILFEENKIALLKNRAILASDKVALVRRRSIIYSSYINNCKIVREAKRKLVIC